MSIPRVVVNKNGKIGLSLFQDGRETIFNPFTGEINFDRQTLFTPLFNTPYGQDASAGYSQQLLSQAYRTAPIEKLRRTADNAEADVRVDLRVSPPRITLDSPITVTSGSSDAVNLRDFVTPPEVQALYGERMYFDGVDDYVDLGAPLFDPFQAWEVAFNSACGAQDNKAIYVQTSSSSTTPFFVIGGGNSAGGQDPQKIRVSLRNDANSIFQVFSSNKVFTDIAREVQVIYDGAGNLDIYIDGALDSSQSWNPSGVLSVDQNTIGASTAMGSLAARVEGVLSDFNFYSLGSPIASLEGHGNTNADWIDTIGSNNGTVVGSPALFTGQGFGASFADLDDQTGNGATATQSTADSQPLIVEDGVLLEGPTFDGVDDFLAVGDVADLGTGVITVCHWIKSTQMATPFRTVQKRGTGAVGATGGWQISRNTGWGGTVMDDAAGNGVQIDSSDIGNLDDMLDGDWHHVAFIFDVPSRSITAYLDGVDTLAGNSRTGLLVNATTTRELTIGAAWDNASTQSQFFDGSLDSVIIYPRALSESDIQQIMEATDPR